MKRFRMVVLLLTILSLAIAGCSSEPAAESGTNGTGEAGATGEATTPPADSPYAEKLDLKLFLGALPGADSNLPPGDKDFVKQAIEENFNVSLNVEYMPMGADRTSKLNMLLASGDTPDLFVSLGSDAQKYVADGIVANVQDLVTPEKTPNYFGWIKEEEVERFQVAEGVQRLPLPFSREIFRSYYIRQDWLNNLGLEVPTTYDEMIEVMRQFTHSDPDQNGRNDTYGYTTIGNGNSIPLDFPAYIKHGLVGPTMIENNKFVDVQSDLRVEGVLDDVKAMLDEGLVDPDWFLAKGSQAIDKAAQGRAGIIMSAERGFAFDSNPASIQNKSKAVNPNADWVPFHPFAETGVWTANLTDQAILFSQAAYDKTPEKIERAAAILDWLCSEEGFLLTHYGVEGRDYTRDGNTITLNPEAYQKNIIEQGNFLAIWGSVVPLEPAVLELEVNDPLMTERDQAIVDTIKSYTILPSIGRNVSPPQGFNIGDFRSKMREFQVKIVFDEPDASNWPTYREELMTEYRGQEMLDVYEEQIRAVGLLN
ncbi:extracellular solute-binding protein [Paenibacillus daejeonensis]|uniref:extracellular solute-binding protein n=1 Tax=Paenibacillus daejeonensis TaxID=135193 RepID=UPI000369159E|nr:extracellular solute-binding protein [Paenibacillus daejeonensis]